MLSRHTYHCRRCGCGDRGAFYPSYRTRCKACLAEVSEPKRAAKREYLAAWRAKHPNAFREWYAAHRERRAEYWRAWYSNNREARAESYRRWAAVNPHVINAIVAKRTAQKRRSCPPWADRAAMRAFYAEAARLTRETGIRHEVDHIVPLQGATVSGLHCETNLRVVTKAENLRKGNKMLSAAQ